MHLIIILLLVFLYLFFKIYNKGIYETLSKKEFICLVIVLVLSIGLRGPGVDNDYTTYVASIGNYLTISEPTFIFISSLIQLLGLPAFILFVFYASIGVSYKMHTIYHNSSLPCVAIIIYISNIALLQDINQIRAGVATALFLIAVPYLAQRKMKKYLLLILLASLFHFSSLLYFMLFFFRKKELSSKTFLFWIFLPVIGYAFYFLLNQSLIENIPITPIRNKLLMYKSLQEMGSEGFADINLFNPYFLFKLFIYYFLLRYYSFLKNKDENFTLYLKIFGISLFVFPVLGAVTPILGYRASDLFACIEILLFPYLFILFKGEKMKAICVGCYFLLLFSINILYKHLIYF